MQSAECQITDHFATVHQAGEVIQEFGVTNQNVDQIMNVHMIRRASTKNVWILVHMEQFRVAMGQNAWYLNIVPAVSVLRVHKEIH
jgi:hypothetical protein